MLHAFFFNRKLFIVIVSKENWSKALFYRSLKFSWFEVVIEDIHRVLVISSEWRWWSQRAGGMWHGKSCCLLDNGGNCSSKTNNFFHARRNHVAIGLFVYRTIAVIPRKLPLDRLEITSPGLAGLKPEIAEETCIHFFGWRIVNADNST